MSSDVLSSSSLSFTDSSSLSIESIKERNVWAFGKPIIEMIPEDANVFNYKLSTINICHFINYINITFKSNMAATVLQNPIFVVFEEMNDISELIAVQINIP